MAASSVAMKNFAVALKVNSLDRAGGSLRGLILAVGRQIDGSSFPARVLGHLLEHGSGDRANMTIREQDLKKAVRHTFGMQAGCRRAEMKGSQG